MTRKMRCPIGNTVECPTFYYREELEKHVKEEHGIDLLYECDICGEKKILPEKVDRAIIRRSECDSCVEKRGDPLLKLFYKTVKEGGSE